MKNFIILISCIILFYSCAAESMLSIDEYYEQAIIFEEQGNLRKALKSYEDLLRFYPRSEYTKEVLLRVADIKFERGNYIDALADYKIYQKYYESLDEAEYVHFRIAKCYFHGRLPYDRDQTFLNRAIDRLQSFVFNYPNSEYLPEALDKIRILNVDKAQAEMDIAVQYEKIRAYRSARMRFEFLLENYPGLGFEEEVYFRMARMYHRMEDTEHFEKYFELLKNNYPDSRFIRRLERRRG